MIEKNYPGWNRIESFHRVSQQSHLHIILWFALVLTRKKDFKGNSFVYQRSVRVFEWLYIRLKIVGYNELSIWKKVKEIFLKNGFSRKLFGDNCLPLSEHAGWKLLEMNEQVSLSLTHFFSSLHWHVVSRMSLLRAIKTVNPNDMRCSV